MKIIRNKNERCLTFTHEDKVVMELKWFHDEFVWIVCKEPVIVTREDDEVFYMQLNALMNNDYQFFIESNLSNKSNDRIEWLSDQYCDLEDKESTDRVNRLIIERVNETFVIKIENPYLKENGINRSSYAVAFSPAGNGYMVKNIETGTNFQDDIVSLFSNTMNNVGLSDSVGPQKKLK